MNRCFPTNSISNHDCLQTWKSTLICPKQWRSVWGEVFWKHFITSLFFQYIQYYQYFQYSLAWYTFQLWCLKILPVCQQCDSLPRRLKRADPPGCLFQSQECENKSDYLLGWLDGNVIWHLVDDTSCKFFIWRKKRFAIVKLPCAMFYIHMSGLPFAFINMHVSWENLYACVTCHYGVLIPPAQESVDRGESPFLVQIHVHI